jgi:hypothetical protein
MGCREESQRREQLRDQISLQRVRVRIVSPIMVRMSISLLAFGQMDVTKDLIGKLMYLPGGLKVRVEHIFEEHDPPRARTRRVGGPHDGIQAFIEVWKLEPCEETEQSKSTKPNPVASVDPSTPSRLIVDAMNEASQTGK